MSVKIYDGLIVERSMSLSDLRDFAKKARPKLDAHAESSQLCYLARIMVNAHDKALMGRWQEEVDGGEGASTSPWANAFGALTDMRSDNRKGISRHLPMDFEACFFAIGEGKTLAIGYGSREQKSLFAKILRAKEYGYWDNSDPLELPKGEWAQRKRDWTAALGKGFELSAAEAGVAVKLVSGKYAQWWSPEEPEVLQAFKAEEFSLARRSAKLAASICEPVYMGRFHADQVSEARVSGSTSEAVRLIETWREAAKSRAKPMLDLTASLLGSALPELGIVGLRSPFKDLEAQGAAMKSMVGDRLALMDIQEPAAQLGRKPGL